jgi:hypothetical protein
MWSGRKYRYFQVLEMPAGAIIFWCVGRSKTTRGETSMSGEGFESVHNYYERLVFEEISRAANSWPQPVAAGLLADIACVALNKLPARYIRNDANDAFFMSGDERETHRRLVMQAVERAFSYVNSGEARVAA